MHKYPLIDLDVEVKIHPFSHENKDVPLLFVKISRGGIKEEFVCKSFSVGEVEYVAQYDPRDWLQSHRVENAKNFQVELPDKRLVSEEEFIEKYISNPTEILI